MGMKPSAGCPYSGAVEAAEETCRSFVQIWAEAVVRQVKRVREVRRKAHSLGRSFERTGSAARMRSTLPGASASSGRRSRPWSDPGERGAGRRGRRLRRDALCPGNGDRRSRGGPACADGARLQALSSQSHHAASGLPGLVPGLGQHGHLLSNRRLRSDFTYWQADRDYLTAKQLIMETERNRERSGGVD